MAAPNNTTSLKEAVTGKAAPGSNPVAVFSGFLDKFKPQMALALPKHLNADRMCRLALTAFSTNTKLQACEPKSIAGAIMIASILGLEIGVDGQGFLVPYKTTCTFVPGWKGMADLVNRSGRATVWTGAVFEGDFFEYELGANPRCVHRPGAEDDPKKLLYTYAIGRVNGAEIPVIEVWTREKIIRHRNKYNKVGDAHYSFRDFEMYARKVPLLQVIKYMPKSIEVMNAVSIAEAAEQNRNPANYDAVTQVVIFDNETDEPPATDATGQEERTAETPPADGKPERPTPPAGTVRNESETPPKPRAAARAPHIVSYAQVSNKLKAAREANDIDALHIAADLIKDVPDGTTHAELKAIYDQMRTEMSKGF